MPVAIALHVLAAIVWVGGMFFAYMALRPVAASLLEPPQRLPLWSRTFGRFFPWVWAAVIILPVTGYWMIFGVFGGMAAAGVHIHVMQGIGLVMIALFVYLYFVPYRAMTKALAVTDLPAASGCLARIRYIVGTNLVLGLIVAAVASSGRYW